MRSAAQALKRLEELRLRFGPECGAEKLALLARLRGPMGTAAQVKRLHELLCFQRAYPDSPAVLEAARGMLERFDRRRDLRRFRRTLADSGIAGTRLSYPFFWSSARWLARHWPERLSVDWADFENKKELPELLPLMLPFAASPVLDEIDLSPREWVRRLKAPRESDAAFLLGRFDNMPAGPLLKEKLYDDLNPTLRLDPGPGTPSRSRAALPAEKTAFQTLPFSRQRPDLSREARRLPLATRFAAPREARGVIALAREAMVTRQRDLYIFENSNSNDVRLMDFGGGLALAWIGVAPERRLLFEALYGFLILKNGIPIGYGGASAFLRSSEIFFNTFESFRGAESAALFARVLAGTRALLGSDTFSLDPYQLGHENDEAIKSGAWWFYRKLGFRPKDPDLLRLMRGEEKKMKARPAHRSTPATLRRLAEGNLYFHLGRARGDVLGEITPGAMGAAALRLLAKRFGCDGKKADGACAREAAALLGGGPRRGWTAAETNAWSRWAPVLLSLRGTERWTPAQRRDLAAVVRAKGGARESDYARLCAAHRPLGKALLDLAARENE